MLIPDMKLDLPQQVPDGTGRGGLRASYRGAGCGPGCGKFAVRTGCGPSYYSIVVLINLSC